MKVLNFIKSFLKEIKRIRWPKVQEGAQTFLTSMTFITICSIILFCLSIGLTAMWSSLGLGI